MQLLLINNIVVADHMPFKKVQIFNQVLISFNVNTIKTQIVIFMYIYDAIKYKYILCDKLISEIKYM